VICEIEKGGRMQGFYAGPLRIKPLNRRASRCAAAGCSNSVATSVPEPAPRPGPGQVLAPM
jgi:hypothetical protein